MSTLEDREEARRMLEQATEKFLAEGGKIREIEFGVSHDVIDYWGETHMTEEQIDEIHR